VARGTLSGVSDMTAGDQTALHVAFQISISLWWKGSSPGAFKYMLSKVNSPGDHASYSLSMNSTQDLRLIIGWGTNPSEFTQSNTIDNASGLFNGNWHHVVGMYDGTGLYIHFDGTFTTSGVAETRAIAYSTDAFFIGSFDGTQLYADGTYAEVAIWNAALTLDDAYSLFKGFSAQMIHPDKLVAYWPLIGRGTTEPDLRHGMDLTFNGTPIQAEHPSIIMPSSNQIRKYVNTAAAPQTKGNQFMPFFG
jgi:hypothetical protein